MVHGLESHFVPESRGGLRKLHLYNDLEPHPVDKNFLGTTLALVQTKEMCINPHPAHRSARCQERNTRHGKNHWN